MNTNCTVELYVHRVQTQEILDGQQTLVQ